MGRGEFLQAPRRWVRALYDWTMHWADTAWGLTALFLISFAESSFFPIPPDVLLIAIVASNPHRWLSAASLATLGSVAGALLGYAIGQAFMATIGQRIVDFYGAQEAWNTVVTSYTGEWGIWFLALASFTPIPFKVATIAAGATGMPIAPFLIVCAIGRAGRFFLVAGLLRVFGAPIRAFLERHFDAMALAFVALLIAGFVVLRFL
jgi:membrane protein YqaA with SNARE-associated domain